MIKPADRERIERALDEWPVEGRVAPAKEAPFDRDDRGVPPDMLDGPVSADGYARWKMLPSTVSEDEVRDWEDRIGASLPPLFRAYLTTRFTFGVQTSTIALPSLLSDNPWHELRQLWSEDGWGSLIPHRYVPFGQTEIGPSCFDLERRTDDGDCPVVTFEHEDLVSLGADRLTRDRLASLDRPVAPSFASIIDNLWLTQGGAGGRGY